uniref:Gag-Pol polyprotein n=1 Tax=Tanacetum cinerariifolium TaxID=118510 RepID=A0A6L2JR84_TANCI|nr:hypothetical protein [Tanacetum cinerariifolium]
MSTQQDIYAAGSKNRPSMLNKENYVSWSSHLLCYAKSRPNRKLIYNSIINGPYVRRMIHEPGDANREVEANDQAIQTILLGLPEDIYAAVDSCEITQEIWLHVQQMMKGSDIRIQEKKAKFFNEYERFTSTDEESIKSYYHRFSKLMNDFKRNKHFPKKIASNLKFLNNLQPEWSRHVTIVHQTKDLHTADYTQLYDFLKYNQKENVGNQNGYNAVQNIENHVVQNVVQNPSVQNVGNQNGLIVVPRIANQNPNVIGNVVAARAESNAIGNNSNQIRCYNYRGLGHLARNCIVSPRRRDAAYLQTQFLIAQKEKARIQLQAEEFDLMAASTNLDEIKEVNANCILMANLQRASTSGTQSDKAPVYDSDGSTEVHNYDNFYDNEIFNMFTQEEQYTEQPEPIPKPHQVQQNDINVIYEVSSVEQGGGTVDQHPATVEETHAYFESLYNNLAIEVKKANTVNRKLRETNADLTTKLARYKNQNMTTLETQLTNKTLYESNYKTTFRLLKTSFEKIFTLKLIKSLKLDGTYSRKDFQAYIGMHPQDFKERIIKDFDLIQKYMIKSVLNDKETEKRMNAKRLQKQGEVDMDNALDASSTFTESTMIDSGKRMIEARLGMIKAQRIKPTHLEMKAVGQGMNAMTKALLGMIRTSDLPMTQNQWLRHRSASQVDVSNNLTKPVTPHSWSQVRKSSFAKPYDVNAPGTSRKSPQHVSFQSPRESVCSNDMVHNYDLDEAKNKAQL